MKVLWLSSWYPSPTQPYDGDFIQRHAKSVAAYAQVTIFYVAQMGAGVNVKQEYVMERNNDGVHERIIFFQFRKTGFMWLDKLIYNFRYYQTYRKAIRQYISSDGKPDLVHVHIPMKAGVIGRWIRRQWGIPYIISEQSSLYAQSVPGNYFTKSYRHRNTVKKIFQDAAAVTNVSAAVGKILKQLFDLPDVRVIHNTVNAEYFNYYGNRPSRFRFIHVSTLSHQKNAEGMLRAFSRLAGERKDFELVLVGPFTKTQKELVENTILQSVVTFTGEINYQAVAEQMKMASVLVLFSRHENFPCVIVEALCCGLPCIATRVGGVEEAVNDSNGILIPSENEDELLSALKEMMDKYDFYDGEAIAALATVKYSYPNIGKHFFELYKQILKEN